MNKEAEQKLMDALFHLNNKVAEISIKLNDIMIERTKEELNKALQAKENNRNNNL